MRIKPPLKPIAWLIAAMLEALRLTCRVRVHDDPRPQLRQQGKTYAFSSWHAHQIAAIMFGERGTGAMVSRSKDGEILIPSLRARGLVPIRGSSRSATGDKGGMSALEELTKHVKHGHIAFLAVDGPRGPRNHVHKGIAALARDAGAFVIGLIVVPSRRWIIPRSWDRMQIPLPFSRLDAYFTEPLSIQPQECLEEFRQRIENEMNRLEQRHDPSEWQFVETRRKRAA